MTDAVVLAGNYADFKLVKTRSVCQLVIEIPIEQAANAVRLFGIPRGGEEIWVAVARMDAPLKPAKERKPFHELKSSAQAALKCDDPDFWEWLAGDDNPEITSPEGAAVALRAACQVASRSQFDTDPEAAARWHDVLRRYVDWRHNRTG